MPCSEVLQAAEFVYESRFFPELEFTFKHALTHDVAYSRVLKQQRRDLQAEVVRGFRQWEFVNVYDRGGGLSHINLYGIRTESVLEPPVLALLPLMLAAGSLVRSRRRD